MWQIVRRRKFHIMKHSKKLKIMIRFYQIFKKRSHSARTDETLDQENTSEIITYFDLRIRRCLAKLLDECDVILLANVFTVFVKNPMKSYHDSFLFIYLNGVLSSVPFKKTKTENTNYRIWKLICPSWKWYQVSSVIGPG